MTTVTIYMIKARKEGTTKWNTKHIRSHIFNINKDLTQYPFVDFGVKSILDVGEFECTYSMQHAKDLCAELQSAHPTYEYRAFRMTIGIEMEDV